MCLCFVQPGDGGNGQPETPGKKLQDAKSTGQQGGGVNEQQQPRESGQQGSAETRQQGAKPNGQQLPGTNSQSAASAHPSKPVSCEMGFFTR